MQYKYVIELLIHSQDKYLIRKTDKLEKIKPFRLQIPRNSQDKKNLEIYENVITKYIQTEFHISNNLNIAHLTTTAEQISKNVRMISEIFLVDVEKIKKESNHKWISEVDLLSNASLDWAFKKLIVEYVRNPKNRVSL